MKRSNGYQELKQKCRQNAPLGLSLLSALVCAACGTLEVRDLKDTFGSKSKGKQSTEQDWAVVRVGLTPSQLLTSKLVDWEPSARDFSLFSFDLVNAASMKFKVSGCASGYSVATTAVASYSTTMKLYKTDKNCEVGLVEFGYDNKTYAPQSVSELKGAAGTSATFIASAGDEFKVKVFRQLVAGGIVDGQDAAFTFLRSSKGTDANVVDYTAGSPLAVNGLEAPAFSISTINLVDIASSDGKGTFSFKLQCAQNLTQPGGSDWACPKVNGETDPQKIINMQVKLVADAANKSTYTYDEIETLMNAGSLTSITNSMKDGSSATNIIIPQLVGPGRLVDYKQMLLILSYTDPSTPDSRGKSYVYFNVDIGNPVP